MAAFHAPPELLNKLEQIARTAVRPRGNVLFRRGDPPFGVFLLRSGSVSLGFSGGPRLLGRTLKPGTVIGLPGTLSGKPYSLTAEVAEDAELGFVPRDAFLQLLRDTPNLCFHVMDMLSEEIVAMRSMMKPRPRRATRSRRPV